MIFFLYFCVVIDIIPLICDRFYYFVVTTLAIMKVGGAFLFIDPEFPIDRIQYIVEEVKAKLVLEYYMDESNKNKLSKFNKTYRY